MSRTYSTTSDHLDVTATIVAAPATCTLACWFKAGNITTNQDLISLGTAGSGDNRRTLRVTATGAVLANCRDTGSKTATSSTVIADTTTWHLLVAVFDGDSSRTAYLDAGGAVSNTTAATPSAPDALRISAIHSATLPVVSAGKIAHIAIWDIALSAGDITSLLTTLPSGVQAANLVGYWPCTANASPETDSGTGGHALTVTGTTYDTDNPTIGGTTRGTPFGHRGTAFNGGRTFHGIIQ